MSPRVEVEINGVTFGPGMVFQKGVAFGGVDFYLYKYFDIAVEEQSNSIFKIVGFYK